MPYSNYTGGKKHWTRDRVIEALGDAAKRLSWELPCCDARWNALKKGRLEWPPAARVLEYFGSMASGWLAAGADPRRVSMNNLSWTAEEEEYLLDNAGEMTLKRIAAKLGRSYGACRRRLYHLRVKARFNQGWLSAAELAKEFACPYHRVRTLLAEGIIPGKYDHKRNTWRVDLADITDEVRELLTAPKRTYVTVPPDLGDYYKRYRLKRTMVDNKLTVVPA